MLDGIMCIGILCLSILYEFARRWALELASHTYNATFNLILETAGIALLFFLIARMSSKLKSKLMIAGTILALLIWLAVDYCCVWGIPAASCAVIGVLIARLLQLQGESRRKKIRQ
mgnify:CR=1 FL=1